MSCVKKEIVKKHDKASAASYGRESCRPSGFPNTPAFIRACPSFFASIIACCLVPPEIRMLLRASLDSFYVSHARDRRASVRDRDPPSKLRLRDETRLLRHFCRCRREKTQNDFNFLDMALAPMLRPKHHSPRCITFLFSLNLRSVSANAVRLYFGAGVRVDC
jgi:hypothetical protein